MQGSASKGPLPGSSSSGDWISSHSKSMAGDTISIGEEGTEIQAIVSRRRDLMYQMAVLFPLATLPPEFFAGAVSLPFSISLTQLLAIGFFAATGLFCLRFIQLHAGLVYNGVRFTAIEHSVRGGILHDMVTASGKPRWDGVSLQITILFALLSAALAGIVTVSFDGGPWFIITSSMVTFAILLGRMLVLHRHVKKSAEMSLKNDFTIAASAQELRTHYVSSIGHAHQDMICLTALAASSTLTALAFSLDHLSSNIPLANKEATGRSLVFLLFAAAVGVIAIRVCTRLRMSIHTSCRWLGTPALKSFQTRIPDSLIGFIVVAATFGLTLALLSHSIALSWSGAPLPIHPIVFYAGGMLVFIATFIWHRKTLQNHERSMSAGQA